jgi:hypothetical protein
VEQAADMLDAADVAHQLREKRVVPRSWRPTYCTVRLQTTDGGAPIAPHTVMVEMGHRSLSMINKIYNRLGASRPKRRPFVEYWRPDARFPGEEQVRKILGEERVDEVLRQAEAEAAPAPSAAPPPLRLVK